MLEPDAQPEVEDLIERARDGDAVAWSRLYEIYEKDLKKRVRSGLSPALRSRTDESTDILQSVWGEAIRSLKGFEYRGDGSFLAWVTAILRNKIARKANEAGRRDRTLAGSVGHGILEAQRAAVDGPSAVLRRQEDMDKLQAALHRLDPDRRALLQMAWFEGLRQREIGERLGISENAARMRISRAEAELTRIFHGLGEKLH